LADANVMYRARAMNVARSQFPQPPDPHAHQPLLTAGPAPEQADATIVLVHGRGASADSILSLWTELALPTLAALAPQAAGHTWYPHSFLAPIEQNQPYLDSGLRRLESIVADLSARGIASDRIALLGFSQGACLVSEFAARHPRRYAAVIALTGGLIGPPETPRDYAGSLDGTPVFLATSDPDPHVPFERVRETEAVLTRMGAVVELRRYPGMPHTINQDELEATRALLQRVVFAAQETRR
jgi:predicted esterase